MKRQNTLTTTQARQASPRRVNLRVLIGSLILSVFAGLFLYFTYVPSTNNSGSPPPGEQQ